MLSSGSGDDDGLGSKDNPIDWNAFVREAKAGDDVQLALRITLQRSRVNTGGSANIGTGLSRIARSSACSTVLA